MKGTSRRTYWHQAQHPDLFVENLFDLDQAAVIEAARRQRQSLKSPPFDADQYLDLLLKQGLRQTTRSLAAYRNLI